MGGYKTAKGMCYDVYYNKKARVPKVLLSQVEKLRKEGVLTAASETKMPFEASIYVYNIQKGEHIQNLVTAVVIL